MSSIHYPDDVSTTAQNKTILRDLVKSVDGAELKLPLDHDQDS